MDGPGQAVETELWCRRCRRIGSRPLSQSERAWIVRLRSDHSRRVAFGLAILPAAFAALTVPLSVTPPNQSLMIVLSVVVFVALLVGLPVSILTVRDHLLARRMLQGDLDQGEAWLFEPAPYGSTDDTAAPAPFALLPRARRVADVRAVSIDARREDVIEADTRSAGGLYAPMSLIPVRAPVDMRFEQRALSGVERSELERIGRALAMPTLSTLIALAGLVALVALISRAIPDWNKPSDWFSVACMVFICVRLLSRYIRSLWIADRIRMDLRVGLVAHVTGRRQPPAEFLPFSKLLWRVQGAPAEWRDRRTAVNRLRSSL